MIFKKLREKYSKEIFFGFLTYGLINGPLKFKKEGISLVLILFTYIIIAESIYISCVFYTFYGLKSKLDMPTAIDVLVGLMPTISCIMKSLFIVIYSDDVNLSWGVMKINFLKSCQTENDRNIYYRWVKYANRFV